MKTGSVALACAALLGAAPAKAGDASAPSLSPARKFQEEKLRAAVMSGMRLEALQALTRSLSEAKKAAPEDPRWPEAEGLLSKMREFDAKFEPLASAYDRNQEAAAAAQLKDIKTSLEAILDGLDIRSGGKPLSMERGDVVFEERGVLEQTYLLRIAPLAALEPWLAEIAQQHLALLKKHMAGDQARRLAAAETAIAKGNWTEADEDLGRMIADFEAREGGGTGGMTYAELVAIRSSVRRFDPQGVARAAQLLRSVPLLPGTTPLFDVVGAPQKSMENNPEGRVVSGEAAQEEEPAGTSPLGLTAAGAVALILAGLWWLAKRRA